MENPEFNFIVPLECLPYIFEYKSIYEQSNQMAWSWNWALDIYILFLSCFLVYVFSQLDFHKEGLVPELSRDYINFFFCFMCKIFFRP